MISLRWLTYIVSSVDKTKLSCHTPTDAAPQFLQKLIPFIRFSTQPTFVMLGLPYFTLESTSEIRPERIYGRRKWPSSCHTWTCCCYTLNNFYKKKLAISYLQTCNINLVFLSLVYSSTNKGKTGKSINTSVVHGLLMSQLFCYSRQKFGLSISAGSFIALNSQSNGIGSRKNEPVRRSRAFLTPCFILMVTSFFHSFPVFLNFSFLSRQYLRVTRAVLCLHGCIFFKSQNKQHAYLSYVRKMQNVFFI